MKTRGLKIKVCGMREPENMRQIAALKPDFFGLIFYPKSPRFVSLNQVAVLPEFSGIRRVGVFVNETVENILKIAEKADLSFVQLHGSESREFCSELKSRKPDLQIVKAFAVDENFDGENLKANEKVCDFFLFDTKTSRHGGSGKSFDWQVLQKLEINRPFFLSGGIGAENAAEAIAACANLPLYALDINSRAEIAPGVKSPEIIEGIIKVL
jgi:phosphoribosylanthranilate isomerase